ncbi:MAG TPA: HAMP domain-containing protein [Steroidobacteraceae bacterium]
MNIRSLSFPLVAWYAGQLTVVFVFLGALTILFLRHYLEVNLLDIQARRAHQIADTLLAGLGRSGDAALARQVETLYSPEANDRFIRVIRSDGEIIYPSGPPKEEGFDPSAVPLPHTALDEEIWRKEVWARGELLVATVPYRGAEGSRYMWEVGTSNTRTERTMSRLLMILAIGLPIAVSIAVVGGFFLVRRALRPVEQIALKAQEITQHNLSERLPVLRTGDELEGLSISLNHLISRLETSIQSLKQFVADASHELRTPLTVVRGGARRIGSG